MTLRSLAIASLLLVTATAPARADVTLYSSPAAAGSGSQLNCVASNTGTKSIDLSVQLFSLSGSSLFGMGCTDLAQGQGCGAGYPGPATAYCKVTSNGSRKAIRGALLVRDANGNAVLSLEVR
jgi:hypothetical protein